MIQIIQVKPWYGVNFVIKLGENVPSDRTTRKIEKLEIARNLPVPHKQNVFRFQNKDDATPAARRFSKE